MTGLNYQHLHSGHPHSLTHTHSNNQQSDKSLYIKCSMHYHPIPILPLHGMGRHDKACYWWKSNKRFYISLKHDCAGQSSWPVCFKHPRNLPVQMKTQLWGKKASNGFFACEEILHFKLITTFLYLCSLHKKDKQLNDHWFKMKRNKTCTHN